MDDYESPVDSVASVVESDSYTHEFRGFQGCVLLENDGKTISTNTPLCYSLVPHVYRLSLFNINFQDPWTYSGDVTIEATASQLCNRITLNAKELEIQSASVELAVGKGSEHVTS